MRRYGFHWSSLAAGTLLLAAALLAVETNQPPAMTSPTAPNLADGVLRHHLSPVDYFRALLGMTPAERERELANKSPADRAVLRAKVREYEALPKEVREARLCQTELHWELLNLMKLAPGERAARLREVSPLYQPMVLGLLKEWDQVPAETQKALLEKQNFLSLYLRMQGSPAAVQQEILRQLPPQRRAHWVEEMGRWQALPEQERVELCARFQQFCSLDGQTQKQTVAALSDDERREMEQTLQIFDRLPPAQRTLCINSFRKFATMAPEGREQFLKNAARWDAMTSSERQLWRNLVHTLPPLPPMPGSWRAALPPMPPGAPSSFPPTPPMPPNVTLPVIVAQSTNEFR